jgi:hypothetical protein
MIYSISTGLKPVSVENKNNLSIGTVLYLHGYSGSDYVIVKNMGIDERWSGYGARYMTICLDDYRVRHFNAFELEFLQDKSSGKIQTYITDEIKPLNEVKTIARQAVRVRKADNAHKRRKSEERERLVKEGRELFKKHIPDDAKALIIAERHKNESDITTDYFAHTTTETVILGYSKHTRDLFSEMRKHAGKIPETAHLGKGKGHFEPVVVFSNDINSNGSHHWKGGWSPWHRELTEKNGQQIIFRTKEEAENYIKAQKPLEPVHCGDEIAYFEWEIREEDLEHREKWSMGAGYYLKDSGSHSSGWAVKKQRKWAEDWGESFYISIAKRCIFE